jgi:small conductance mechanosensitive channel
MGDFVEAGGVSGTIEEINLFSTVFKSGDNKVLIVPNSSIISSTIINYSKKETRRVDLLFGISYDDDLKLAKETLLEIVSQDTRVLQEPAPFVAVSALADSSVNFVVRVWVNKDDYWAVFYETTEKVKLTFDARGITIPYPQMQLHRGK